MTTSGRIIARNTVLNLLGQAAPFLVGFLSMPATVHGLGTARFGLLGLVWVVVGYFTVLDFGMGRAVTRFTANAIARKAFHEIPAIVWSAVVIQGAVGLVGGATLLAGASLLVERVLHIDAAFQSEARATFHVMAFAVPIVLVAATFRGVLEAAQRFDLANAVSIPGSALNFLVPLTGALAHWSLPQIVWLLVAARAMTLGAYAVLASRLFPGVGRPFRTGLHAMRDLLPFGAWITVSNVVSPVLDQLDRLLLGSLAGVVSVGYYTPPQETVMRMRVLPTALAGTLFPEFSAQSLTAATPRTRAYYAISLRFLALILAPVTLALVLLGPDLLRVWLGADFARTSGTALRLLAIGGFANSLAYVPFNFLQGINRPDLPAKFHLVELPLVIALAAFLIPRFGVSGAGAVWAARACTDATLLLASAAARGATSPSTRRSLPTLAWGGALGLLIGLGFLPVWSSLGAIARLVLAGAAGAALLGAGWPALLTPEHRDQVRAAFRRLEPAQ